MGVELSDDRRGEPGVRQVTGRDVDRNLGEIGAGESGLPVAASLHGVGHDLLVHGDQETSVLGYIEKGLGLEQSALRVAYANEGFGTDEMASAQIEDRLVLDHEPVILEGPAQHALGSQSPDRRDP